MKRPLQNDPQVSRSITVTGAERTIHSVAVVMEHLWSSPEALSDWETEGGLTLVQQHFQELTMINAAVLTAINKQIRHEQSNAHAYHAVSLYFGRLNLHGLKAFMAQQAGDERMHAEKFIQHVVDRGGHVDLGAIPSPTADFESPLEAVKSVRDLEHTTTEMIHRLFELARKEGDWALEVLLGWYITEQVEEEQWSNELMALMEQFHEHRGQVFMLDHQWGKRVKEKLG